MSQSIIAPNLMKQALQNGQSLTGTMVAELRQPSVMQLLKHAGFDFAIIDGEHGPFNLETVADLSRAAKLVGLTPIVRVPDLAYAYLVQPLDAGAQGLMLPRICDAEQVRQAVRMITYSPGGSRGCALSRGHTNFKSGPLVESMAEANAQRLVIIQIETQEAIENIEEIMAVPGVDVTLIGPTDLSIALGVPGEMDSPKLHAAIETMLDACVRHQVYPAIHINNLEWAAYWAKKGMRVISSASETELMVRGGLALTSTLSEAFAT